MFRPGAGQLAVAVRSVFGSAVGGNGIGRPAAGQARFPATVPG